MTRSRALLAAAIGVMSVVAFSLPAAANHYWRHGRPYYPYYAPPVYYYPPPPPAYYRPYYPPRAYYPPPRSGFSFYFSN